MDRDDIRTLTMYALRLQGSWKAMLARKYLNTVKLMKYNFMCLQTWMKVKLFYKLTVKKILNIKIYAFIRHYSSFVDEILFLLVVVSLQVIYEKIVKNESPYLH